MTTTQQQTWPDGVIARYPLLSELAGGRPLADMPVTVTMDKPSYHGRTELTVRLGQIDADAIEFFGFAKCQLLASALHELTGWPFGLAYQLVDGEWKWAHAGVITPRGLFLDIHGVRPLSEVVTGFEDDYGLQVRITTCDTYEECHAAIVPAAPVVSWTGLVAHPLGVELVRYFADHLVARAEVA